MTSRSDQTPQPPQRQTPLTDAEVAELIKEAMKEQSVFKQVCGGVGRLGETVTDAARHGCGMLSNAFELLYYGPTKPIENKDTTNVEFRNPMFTPQS